LNEWRSSPDPSARRTTVIERILLAADGPGAWPEICGAGLIAMSCRPRPLPRYMSTGSVSQGVVMRAGCLVVVVREPGFRV
jgi:nucleotide-binding universal stress UspA family protein